MVRFQLACSSFGSKPVAAARPSGHVGHIAACDVWQLACFCKSVTENSCNQSKICVKRHAKLRPSTGLWRRWVNWTKNTDSLRFLCWNLSSGRGWWKTAASAWDWWKGGNWGQRQRSFFSKYVGLSSKYAGLVWAWGELKLPRKGKRKKRARSYQDV